MFHKFSILEDNHLGGRNQWGIHNAKAGSQATPSKSSAV
jgi:hypothetical protein